MKPKTIIVTRVDMRDWKVGSPYPTTRVLLPVVRIDEVREGTLTKYEQVDGKLAQSPLKCSLVSKLGGESFYALETPRAIQDMIEGLV